MLKRLNKISNFAIRSATNRSHSIACRIINNTHLETMKKRIPGLPAKRLKKLKMARPPKTVNELQPLVEMNSPNSFITYLTYLQKKPA